MHPKSLLIATIALLMAGPGPAFAAGGHGHGQAHAHDTAAIGRPAAVSAARRTIRVEMHDNHFTPDTLRVKAGETIRFVVTNKGDFLHEFSLGTAAMHAEHQKTMAVMMEHGMLTPTGIDAERMKMDHSAMPGMDHGVGHDHANGVLVEPGKTADFAWTFDKTVDLEFACNVPGHYEAGMVGTVVIGR
ncbi:cupredoxin domain-containing protein [Azospirillum halopraeferens]|uniref:cupredoxin domain-containing protein n=1 Tax=Azospirillum halopraeferens TaxID=34010 RepID=UPI0003F93B88|nr:cupredoxin domain-containing protein [Azospirillum halopraeferens]